MEIDDDFSKHILMAESKLGLPKDFYNKVCQENDWNFVIQSHALLETIVTKCLEDYSDKRLIKIVHGIPLCGEISKTSMLRDLDLLSGCERTFLKRFSEIRNVIVHDIRHLNFSIKEYFQDMDKEKRRAWISNSHDLFDHIARQSIHDHFLRNPRAMLEDMVRSMFVIISLVHDRAMLEKETLKLKEECYLLSSQINELNMSS